MTDGPRAGAPLSVATDLELTVDGATVEVRSTGERLFVEVPSLSAALTLLRGVRRGDRDRFAALLATADLTVEVRVREATVAVAGAGARPGPLSAELGVAPAEVRVGGAVAAVGRELRAGIATVGRLVTG